jgi:phosphoribosylglycinamide formyltransferase-1
VTQIVNLVTDLDAGRFAPEAKARALRVVESSGYDLRVERSASDRLLAWIDEVFGGAWSSEAFLGTNLVAYAPDGSPAGFTTIAPRGLRYAWLRGLAAEHGVGIFGPFGVDPSHRGGTLGASLLVAGMCELRERGYAQALIPAVGPPRLVDYYVRHAHARIAERFELRAFTPEPVRTVVMASGNGSNFQSVLDRVADGGLPLNVRALVTNNPNAHAIERAKAQRVPSVHVLSWRKNELSRAAYDARLLEIVAAEEAELVLLLGWMHLLDDAFVSRFPNLINVHPAFLPIDVSRDEVGMPDGSEIPVFRGAHAVRDALAASSPWVGASVHLVTMQADRGPVLVRRPLRVRAGEDERSLLERLHPLEHQLVERGIRRWLFER